MLCACSRSIRRRFKRPPLSRTRRLGRTEVDALLVPRCDVIGLACNYLSMYVPSNGELFRERSLNGSSAGTVVV
jgi:hypothetical protein